MDDRIARELIEIIKESNDLLRQVIENTKPKKRGRPAKKKVGSVGDAMRDALDRDDAP